MFGYKLHITLTIGSTIVPLSGDFTQADIQDNQMYPAITSSLPQQGVCYMAAADSGYAMTIICIIWVQREDLS